MRENSLRVPVRSKAPLDSSPASPSVWLLVIQIQREGWLLGGWASVDRNAERAALQRVGACDPCTERHVWRLCVRVTGGRVGCITRLVHHRAT